jgi:hypothetical protein
MDYKLNKIQIAFENYRYYLRGQKKSGKTTLFRDLILQYYKNAANGLLISFGNELGYKSLDNLYAVEAPDWSTFIEIVDDLVENRDKNTFKMVCLDTVDELVSIATEEVLRIHYRRKGEKVDTLNQALGGFSAGHVKVQELINDQMKRIESAGYGMMFLGHCKIRQIKEKGSANEDGYSQLTSNLDARFDSIFADKADIIATIFSEKSVEDKKLLNTQRYIYFRSDNFVEAGSRFANMPERVEYGAKEFIDAVEQGVKSSFSTPVSDKDLERMKKEELDNRKKKADVYVAKAKTGSVEEADTLHTAEDYITLIDKEIASLDKEDKRRKQEELKEHNVPTKYKELTDIEVLKTILKVVSSK